MILVLDFGSQVTQLIARRYRELGFPCLIHPFSIPLEKVREISPKAIVLSGGPASVYDPGAPQADVVGLLNIAPVLGICYGMQLLASKMQGKVQPSSLREYGHHEVQWDAQWMQQQKANWPQQQHVWMSHGDIVAEVPPQGKILAMSESQKIASFYLPASSGRSFSAMALQFHPEVAHTDQGSRLLQYFAEKLSGMKPTWSVPQMESKLSEQIRQQVGPKDRVLCALSGGVDSSVVATLLTKVLGPEKVHCVFVDTGLLRWKEAEEVLSAYKKLGLQVDHVQAQQKFFAELAGESDPETKRKIIGRLFIETFEEHLEKNLVPKSGAHRDQFLLAQGTLYPDVIESVSPLGGPSHKIKSHHNVGGLPEKMRMRVLEPVRELFKDEVRLLGVQLGLPSHLVDRHPFPGPGLAIRILGEVTPEQVAILQAVDHQWISFLREKELYHKIWQAFAVLLPVKTVGVQGDGRTYEQVVALRAVTSVDGMTADWYPFGFDLMREVSKRITNSVKGVSRVVYDVTSKPPATIEWE